MNVFQPSSVRVWNSFVDPHQYSTGVDWVLVNGVAAVADGAVTGATPGKVLRSKEE